MSADVIRAEIERIAQEQFDWQGNLRDEMRLVEDLRLDSLKLLSFAIEIENYFRVCLDPEDEAAISTVGHLVQTLERKLKK